MLLWLENNYPNDGWSGKHLERAKPAIVYLFFLAYLNGTTSVNWTQIIVSGHSQGSGHAAFIGMLQNCSRIIQYGGCTDLYSNGDTPSWTNWTPITPREAYYGKKKKKRIWLENILNWLMFFGRFSFKIRIRLHCCQIELGQLWNARIWKCCRCLLISWTNLSIIFIS